MAGRQKSAVGGDRASEYRPQRAQGGFRAARATDWHPPGPPPWRLTGDGPLTRNAPFVVGSGPRMVRIAVVRRMTDNADLAA